MNFNKNVKPILYLVFLGAFLFQSCQTFRYKTFDPELNKDIEDPEPDYNVTLDPSFQDFTSYMFIGNRVENFSTYFNTYYNATENFNGAYDDYVTRVLSTYGDKLDSIMDKPALSQEAIDKFNQSIEKASKIIQYHKSSVFMDKSVLLVGKAYYYLGDYLKAERKFSEFLSKLSTSTIVEEAVLFMAKTQMRLDNFKPALEKLDELIVKSKDRDILSGAYQSKAEYYLYIKDYDNAINNFRKAIEYSTDNEFKAQMQFLVATVTERTNPLKAAGEYDRVLDYGVSFDLEYLARYNNVKNLIANSNSANSLVIVEDMEIKYKDNPQYLGDISYMRGLYFEQKKDMKSALEQYYYVMQTYPSTKPASDASYRVALWEESVNKDYLNAYRYYRYSTEQSTAGSFYKSAYDKSKVYKRYYELKSTITGSLINTDYDSTFKVRTTLITPEKLQDMKEGPSKDFGKPGGNYGSGFIFADSVINESKIQDSLKSREKEVAQAKYELAELFLYDLNGPDSCEYYLKDAFDNSSDYEFRAKVLFALANLYRTQDNGTAAAEVLNRILQEFPSSAVVNSSKRLLNIPVDEAVAPDPADSLYWISQEKFLGRDYEAALNGFKTIIGSFNESKYFPRSLYASGWIYENIYMKPDSAYLYYTLLASKAPGSEFISVISPKLDEYNLLMKTTIDTSSIKDTSVVKDTLKSETGPELETVPRVPEEIKSNENSDPSGEPDMKKEEPIQMPEDNNK